MATERTKGRFAFLDARRSLGIGSTLGHEALRALYTSIQEAVGRLDQTQPPLIVVDDSSSLVWAGVDVEDILRFHTSLRALQRKVRFVSQVPHADADSTCTDAGVLGHTCSRRLVPVEHVVARRRNGGSRPRQFSHLQLRHRHPYKVARQIGRRRGTLRTLSSVDESSKLTTLQVHGDTRTVVPRRSGPSGHQERSDDAIPTRRGLSLLRHEGSRSRLLVRQRTQPRGALQYEYKSGLGHDTFLRQPGWPKGRLSDRDDFEREAPDVLLSTAQYRRKQDSETETHLPFSLPRLANDVLVLDPPVFTPLHPVPRRRLLPLIRFPVPVLRGARVIHLARAVHGRAPETGCTGRRSLFDEFDPFGPNGLERPALYPTKDRAKRADSMLRRSTIQLRMHKQMSEDSAYFALVAVDQHRMIPSVQNVGESRRVESRSRDRGRGVLGRVDAES